MALTLTPISKPHVVGDRWRSVTKAACDNSYPTGGYSLKPADLGFASTVDDEWYVQIENDFGYGVRYDYTNQKLLVFSPTRTFTATFDPASLAAVTSRDDAITFTGVLATDQVVAVIPPAAILASVVVQNARVTGADTITVRLTNPSAGAVDVSSGTWTAIVLAGAGLTKEVPNATDLTALNDIRIAAFGRFRA